MKKTILFILATVLLMPGQDFAEEKPGPWEQIKKENGITVYRREIPGSSIVMFKGKGFAHSEMVYVLAVMSDVEKMPEWVESLKKTRVIEKKSETNMVIHNIIGAPWPLQDRDSVSRGRVFVDKNNKWIHIRARNIKHPKAPAESGKVRIPFMRATWSFKPMKEGKDTWVEFQVQADPGGIIPAWAANMASKNIPYKSIMNLRKRIKKGKFNPRFVEKYKSFSFEKGL